MLIPRQLSLLTQPRPVTGLLMMLAWLLPPPQLVVLSLPPQPTPMILRPLVGRITMPMAATRTRLAVQLPLRQELVRRLMCQPASGTPRRLPRTPVLLMQCNLL